MKLFSKFVLSSVFLIFCQSSNAVQIVSVQLDYDNRTEILDLELFDDQVGSTVANFMSYVNTERYDGTFIYRAIPNFVIQTGGYTFRPNDPLTDGLRPIDEPGSGLALVPEDSTLVINNPVLSNIRGTLALAKQSGDPDSGADEWFINLTDNSENLDNQNGGFTVFGSVIDDGMLFADEISVFPIQIFAGPVLGPSFSSLPVVNYDFLAIPSPLVLQSNLVMLTSFTVIDRPIIRMSPAIVDFELDNSTDGLSKIITVTLENTGTEILDIEAIASLDAPYNIATDNCSSTALDPVSITPGSNCTIDIEFSAASVGTFESTITIPYTSAVDTEAFTVSYDITGEGVPSTPVLDTSVDDFIFVDTIIETTSETIVTVRNRGDGFLTINTIGLSGTDSNQYAIDSVGCIAGTTLTINQTCDVLVTFSPITAGFKIASLDIVTNAGTSNIALSGLATKPVLDIPTIDTFSASLNETDSKLVSITNTGTGNLIISDLSITGTGAASFSQINNCPDTNNSGSPNASLDPGQQCLLFLTYEPTDGSNKTATIVIQSNDPDSPTINVDISGFIVDSFISTASAIDLGSVQIDSSSSPNELVITNTGLAPLEISGITGLANTDFSQLNDCTGSSFQLATDETCSVSITFTPSTLGIITEMLTITSNDPANPSVNVDITGFGFDNIITDPLITTASNLDLGTAEIGGSASTKDLIVTNRGLAPLEISDISGLTNPDFSQVNNCIGIQIATDATCSISINYTASTLGAVADTLTITSNDPANPSINVDLSGIGVDDIIEDPVISTVNTLDIGTAQINGTPATRELVITNIGLEPLVISGISGLTNTDFSQVNNCIGTDIQINTDTSCTFIITFTTSTPGITSGVITITSNDPANPSIDIDISGFGDNDSDGILSSIELSGPSAGDGNNDNILDDIQSNVATLIASNSKYITFVADDSLSFNANTTFADVILIDNIPTNEPETAAFDYGLFGYSITLLPSDGVNVAIFLPPDVNPTTFYKHGPTASNTTPHWYDFSFDTATGTGAKFFGEVSIESPTGTKVQKNLVIVTYFDGRIGDDDLAVNGSILNNTSGLSFENNNTDADSGSSSGSLSYLQMFILLIIALRRKGSLHKSVRQQIIT